MILRTLDFLNFFKIPIQSKFIAVFMQLQNRLANGYAMLTFNIICTNIFEGILLSRNQSFNSKKKNNYQQCLILRTLDFLNYFKIPIQSKVIAVFIYLQNRQPNYYAMLTFNIIGIYLLRDFYCQEILHHNNICWTYNMKFLIVQLVECSTTKYESSNSVSTLHCCEDGGLYFC